MKKARFKSSSYRANRRGPLSPSDPIELCPFMLATIQNIVSAVGHVRQSFFANPHRLRPCVYNSALTASA